MSQRKSPLAQLFAVEPENDWRAQAACRTMDPELFFSSEDFENKQERAEREAIAKAVCSRCVVVDDCLSYAIEAQERYGVWGGMTAQERRAAVRQRTRTKATEQVS